MRGLASKKGTLIGAAVIVPVYRDTRGEVRFIIVRRSAGGVHGGQLAFPGGKRERGDGSLLETAIREAQEEIGLVVRPESVLAQLPEVTTKTTGFRIAPFLCHIIPPQRWELSSREIAEVIDIGLDELTHQGSHVIKMVTVAGGQEEFQPYFAIGPYKLWGATYRILQPLLGRFTRKEWLLEKIKII